MFFKKNKKTIQERSKFVETPKVFVSLGRTVNLGNFNSIKFDAGVSLGVGDTMTIMSEGVTAVQQNETVADAFKRSFIAVTQELDRQAEYYKIVGMNEWIDAIRPSPPKPSTTVPAPAIKAPPEKPASQKAVAQLAQPAQQKKPSIAERLAAETDKLKERGKNQ